MAAHCNSTYCVCTHAPCLMQLIHGHALDAHKSHHLPCTCCRGMVSKHIRPAILHKKSRFTLPGTVCSPALPPSVCIAARLLSQQPNDASSNTTTITCFSSPHRHWKDAWPCFTCLALDQHADNQTSWLCVRDATLHPRSKLIQRLVWRSCTCIWSGTLHAPGSFAGIE